MIFWTMGLVALFIAMSPGPDFILVTRYSTEGSRRLGMLAAVGIMLGLAFHVTYVLAGLSALLYESKAIYLIIKYLGAAYLAYLGIKILLSTKNLSLDTKQSEKKEVRGFEAFRAGLICNLLNPKAGIFMISLFSQVMTPDMPLWTRGALGLELLLVVLVWYFGLAIFLTNEKIHRCLQKIQKPFNYCMGIFLLFFSLRIALLS